MKFLENLDSEELDRFKKLFWFFLRCVGMTFIVLSVFYIIKTKVFLHDNQVGTVTKIYEKQDTDVNVIPVYTGKYYYPITNTDVHYDTYIEVTLENGTIITEKTNYKNYYAIDDPITVDVTYLLVEEHEHILNYSIK